MPIASNPCVLALDVGGARIGVAVASKIARISRPYGTFTNDSSFLGKLQEVINEESIEEIVVGYPRNQSWQSTSQTAEVEQFAEMLRKKVDIPGHFQDESVTSKQAEQELIARGKPYKKADIDALAATYILEDYMESGANA